MANWLLSDRPVTLDEFLRQDGLGDSTTPEMCFLCKKQAGEYRCTDCFGGYMQCSGCAVSSHRLLPLHRLEVCLEFLESQSRVNYFQF